MIRPTAWIVVALSGITLSVQAQQPVRPLPKTGSCPVGYFTSGQYCMPGRSQAVRGAIEKHGSSCPVGFFSSGNYCLSHGTNQREAMRKLGPSCPTGWLTSGSYCVKSR